MSGILNISEATALAIHAMIYIEANSDRKVSTREIAEEFDASEAHLSKVLQRLVRSGYVKSVRGPKGGFTMEKQGSSLPLIHLYELFEGMLPEDICMFQKSSCTLKRCAMDDFLGGMKRLVLDYMNDTTVNKLAGIYLKRKEEEREA
ncbi:RrF2 family transcriptional regulator [Candidatus Omnitrophota bacterium]